MGLNTIWQEDVIASLSVSNLEFSHSHTDGYELLIFTEKGLFINLLSLDQDYIPATLIEFQERSKINNQYLVNLWEDVWHTRKPQVIGRIKSLLGLNQTLHARKSVIKKLSQLQADVFLEASHLQASARSRYKFGLFVDDTLYAVACFSNLRLMKHISADYRSAELIRFASQTGVTITGGFSKLLKHFINNYQPDDIMSYADRDWSLGAAYERSGFELSGVTAPAVIWIDKSNYSRHFDHRIDSTSFDSGQYIKIFNTGNHKYILRLK